MQVPGGPLKTRIRIEYDDSLLCHAVTVPECLDQRNLSRWPGVVVDRAFSFCDCGKVAERAAGQQVAGLDQGCPVEFAGGHGQGKTGSQTGRALKKANGDRAGEGHRRLGTLATSIRDLP